MRETRTAQSSIFDFYSQRERSEFFKNLSAKLDQHPERLTLIESDLLTQGAQTSGRKGLSVESIFRCLLLKQITGSSYEQLSFLLTDSRSYRTFARNAHLAQAKPCLKGSVGLWPMSGRR